MRSPETFDAYYVETRTRLLHEAYALTGDAPASRAAVRDAFVVTWHHWRKVGGLDDRDGYVRPLAFRRARRKHTARIWHRDKSLAPEVRATLDALSKLTPRQRELLVLNGLSSLSLTEIGRMVGLPRSDAERELQTATSQFSLARDVQTTDVRRLLQDLAAPLEEIRWPRATVIRRAGAARRRTHTVIGAGVAAAALVVSGSLVATGADAEPTSLREEKVSAGITVHAPEPVGATGEPIIDEAALLVPGPDGALRRRPRLVGDRHHATTCRATASSHPASASGSPTPRASPPSPAPGRASATRTVRTKVGKGDRAAHPQAQRDAGRVDRRPARGDVARRRPGRGELPDRLGLVRRLRRPAHPAHGHQHGQARRRRGPRLPAADVGQAARDPHRGRGPHRQPRGHHRRPQHRSRRERQGDPHRPRRLRQRALRHRGRRGVRRPGPLEPDRAPRHRRAARVPVGGRPAAGRRRCADRGWAPTPSGPRTNYAATRCDRTTFAGKGITRAKTRTFVFLETPNATQLGLTQTIGEMTAAQGPEVRRDRPHPDPAVRPGQPRHHGHPARLLVVQGGAT